MRECNAGNPSRLRYSDVLAHVPYCIKKCALFFTISIALSRLIHIIMFHPHFLKILKICVCTRGTSVLHFFFLFFLGYFLLFDSQQNKLISLSFSLSPSKKKKTFFQNERIHNTPSLFFLSSPSSSTPFTPPTTTTPLTRTHNPIQRNFF